MENLSLSMLLLPLATLSIVWMGMLAGRLRGWRAPDEQDQPGASPEQPAPSVWYQRLWSQSWSRWLALIGLAGILYFIFFAPPRIGGSVHITPNQSGRPFYNFHWQQEYISKNPDQIGLAISLGGSLLSLLALTSGLWQRRRETVQAALLLAGLTLAALGQWLLGIDMLPVGAVYYGLAALALIHWLISARQRLRVDLSERPAWLPANEIWLLVALVALAAFARFYVLRSIPYGVEGDESKWIFEVVELMIDGEAESSGEYHRDALPGSFYMQAPFQRAAVGIFSARVAVVLYSILGTLAFYWLLRQIAPLPLAALGTFFLSISVMDISASRLANVESHVKLWPILALALLALALQRGRWQLFALSGLALAAGLLTYDTVLPVFGVMLLALVIEFFAGRVALKKALQNLAAFLLPPLLTLPLLLPYFNSRLRYYQIEEKGWNEGWWPTLWENLGQVVQSWFVDTRFDFIYNRQGPILNAVLLPLFFVGIIFAFGTLRQRVSRWALLWMILLLIPVPVLTASPFGRVYYPGLPAVYALIALGGYVLVRELARLLKPNLSPLGLILVIAFLGWLPFYNAYLYFNGVGDPADRQIRREIGEFALDAAQDGAHLYLPYWPIANDPLFIEWQIAELYLHQELAADEIAAAYEQVPLDDFLPRLAADAAAWPAVDILIDTQTSTQRDAWDAMRATLLNCYPGGVLTKGHLFERYHLEVAQLVSPACTPVRLQLAQGIEAEDADPSALPWNLSNGSVDSLRVVCEQEPQNLLWVEGEDMTLGPGWARDVAFVEGWQGSGYLVDNYGSQAATYHTEFAAGEAVYVWVRSYKRVADNAPAQMSLDSQQLIFADSAQTALNKWVWERLGPYETSSEMQDWRIERPYDAPPPEFIALFIDNVVFTSDSNFSPLGESGRSVVHDAIYEFETAASEGYLQINLPAGRYFCRVGLDGGAQFTNAYGNPEVWSNSVELNLEP
ncbi:MAG: hypothetical protein HN413_11040 [Chloroflexi bacterium]|jgi:hypothetical protein|nr:hypothetical protein [Chloroflexota bacterium]